MFLSLSGTIIDVRLFGAFSNLKSGGDFDCDPLSIDDGLYV